MINMPRFVHANQKCTVLISMFVIWTGWIFPSNNEYGFAEGQRKAARPPPAVSETKERERANFDCPEEFGYYPHPGDCTQYYVCVFGGALLESCTGGLMYSHELQTCDWPRNVGCDGLDISGPIASAPQPSNSGTQVLRSRERERPRERERDDVRVESRTKYSPPPPPPPPQPKAVVTSRGHPRQLQNQQEIIKQQLYADVDEALPPAEEIESDRQQRVYRGQPSIVGQVQRDRDGYRHTNALPTYKDRGEKIGVISFGTQSQLQHYSTAPDLNEILTNDLTVKKRRKRNAQRSRAPHNDPTSWHAVQRKRYTHHNRQHVDNPRHKLATVSYKNQQPFQPFIRNYALPSNTVTEKFPPPKSFQYFNPNAFAQPITSATAHNINPATLGNNNWSQTPAKYGDTPLRHTVEYTYNNLPVKPLETAFTNTVPQTVSPKTEETKEHAKTNTEAITSSFIPSLPVTAEQSSVDKIKEEFEVEKPKYEEYQKKFLGDFKEEPELEKDGEDRDIEEAKESESKDTEAENEDPKNSTVTYEYHSEEVDEDLGPPPSFFNNKNKYEDIYNPFEDPHFDFDQFLEKLGSTTTTTTTSTTTTTTTTTTPKPTPKIIPQVIEESRPVSNTASNKINLLPNFIPIRLIQNRLPPEIIHPATPSPLAFLKPVIEDLGEDFYDDKSIANKKVYSSKVKTSPRQEIQKTTASPDEYEYYYEEYDYPEPSSSKGEISKVLSKNQSEPVKYSAKYQEKPKNTDLDEKNSKLSYNIASQKQVPGKEQYLIETNLKPTTPKAKQSLTTTAKPIPTPFSSTTEHPKDVNAGQFLIETSAITTTTTTKPKTAKTITPARKGTTVRPTQKPQKQKQKPTTTESYELDSRQAQSNLITSEDKSTVSQAPKIPAATATARTLYNNSQYNNINQNDNRYDPYYALYDEDVELYKDVDYTPQNNNNNNYNSNTANTKVSTTNVYRGAPAVPVREESAKRGNVAYNNVNQDIYQQPSTVTDYSDNSYQEEENAYRQSSRAPTSLRGDRNEINDIEDVLNTKRTTSTSSIRKLTTTTPRITTTTQARTLPPKKITTTSSSQAPVTAIENQTQALSNNTNPGHIVDVPKSFNIPTESRTENLRPDGRETTTDFRLHEPYAVGKTPTPFLSAQYLTTVKPAFHFITKAPKSTHQISASTETNANADDNVKSTLPYPDAEGQSSIRLKTIVPTTYAPKYLLKSILPKTPALFSPVYSFRPKNNSRFSNNLHNKHTYPYKTLKAVRKVISPITLNHELLSTSTGATYESAKDIVDSIDYEKSEESSGGQIQFVGVHLSPKHDKNPVTTSTTPATTILPVTTTREYATTTRRMSLERHNADNEVSKNRLHALLAKEKLKHYVDKDNITNTSSEKRFRITVEVPPLQDILDNEDIQKPEPDEPPSYKPKPILVPSTDSKTDSPVNTSYPTRVSRVNAAIKSLIAIAGTKGPSKCSDKDPKCKVEAKQRTPSRGRGTSHYTNSASVASNEVSVNANRGTPAPRSRPTLKPSTSIVSKASEFIDIYKFPPRRPEAFYPQPQPDKTAAKCRKDVCLLPDCSCGGKDIPGDVPAEQTPQIVLMTFDDAVNDLNKQYYIDIFENGRKNPNGCPISATFYVSHEWTDYSQVQNLYADGHELASHTVSHSFGEQFSQKKWTREVAGQREILAAYGGVKLEDVRGMRAPFLSVGGNKMFKMLYDSNFTYDSSMPIYENKPPSWPYTLDYKLFHDCMIPPCPTRSYPGVWEVPMVMWQDLNGGRCSMGDACSNPPDAEGVFKMLLKNFERHYTTNRAPFGLFYHAAWFTQPHHKEGFINFIDTILAMKDVWLLTNWQALQWVRDPTPTSKLNNFQPFQCDYSDRPKRCNNPKVCNLWHKSGVRYMRTCQPCPDIYPWTGNTGIRSSRIDNDIED